MLGDGVDLSDPAAINQWMNDFNARSYDERASVLSDEVIGGVLPFPAVEVPDEDVPVAPPGSRPCWPSAACWSISWAKAAS